MDGKFVEFRFTCLCGANLLVHCQHIPAGPGRTSQHAVISPKCDKEHEMPAPLHRFFSQNAGEEQWNLVPQRNVI